MRLNKYLAAAGVGCIGALLAEAGAFWTGHYRGDGRRCTGGRRGGWRGAGDHRRWPERVAGAARRCGGTGDGRWARAG